MTSLEATLLAVRFGYGLAPGETPPGTPEAILEGLGAPDAPPAGLTVASLDARNALQAEQREARQLRRKEAEEGERMLKAIGTKFRKVIDTDSKSLFLRAATGPSSFRERLVSFWADHFTVAADNRLRTLLSFNMIETAIRPNVAASFPKMLSAVTKHPAMLVYLNQNRSVGPNSEIGKRREAGLNENLAREILELHTLGVNGSYSQADVTEFAELLTGMRLQRGTFKFDARMAEPGAETVLGTEYGGRRAKLGDIEQALEDLALNEQTARHLAAKLIVHFVGALPAQDFIDKVADAYLGSNGALIPTYRALLEDERAWALPLQKAKLPFDFIVSTMRALGATAGDLTSMKPRQFVGGIITPMARMGQSLLTPPGPDGWPEEPEAWITPSNLAARVLWANSVAQQRAKDYDPRVFLDETLGPLASPILSRAVAGAETRHEGVALVLASPEFNRR